MEIAINKAYYMYSNHGMYCICQSKTAKNFGKIIAKVDGFETKKENSQIEFLKDLKPGDVVTTTVGRNIQLTKIKPIK